ncbi:uncharacterized protein [Littorina saxatilis]|uniref:uncharacterized protein isoform X3 n=1 Tax=Littorina saxatilis TaxID=31220 RepID=UPI0038B56941
MEAKQEHTTTLLFFVLVVCVLSGQAQSVFDIPQCANRGVFTIGRDNQFSITCTGLHTLSNIYWSISSPLTNGTEIRLGECATCYPNCANTDCSNSNSRDYSITRNQSDVTTLTFVDNLEQNEGALIKCSQRNNNTKSQAYCATAFINATHRPQFKLTECTNGVLEILPSQTVNLTCTGLWPGSNIYWSLTGPSTNHTEVRLGDCPLCFPKCSSTPCNIPKGIYSISRHRYDVTVLDNVHLDDGDTITCSQWNNESTAQSTCTIRTAGAYQLPQCQDGQLDVSAVEPWTAIMCEGLRSYHTITWTLTDSANLTTEIAGCNSACYVTTDDVIVSRTEAASELKITGKMLEKNKNIVTCGRQDGATGVSCRLRVFGAASSAFPLIAAAGGGGAALLLIIIVIVVVVIVASKRKKQRKRQAKSDGNVNASYNAAAGDPYDSLQMSHVGLSSEYSAIGNTNTGSQPQAAAAGDPYGSLRMSDVGLSSEYSAIGNTNIGSKPQAAGDQYGSLRLSDVGLSSEYSAIGNTNTGSQPQAGQPTHYDSLQVSDIGKVSTYSVIGDN